MQIDAALAAKLAIVLDRLLAGKTLAVAAVEAGMSASEVERFARELKRELGRKGRATPVLKIAGGGLRLIAYADGGSRGNPGKAACGVLVTDADGAELLRRAKTIGKATNNVAEYEGVLYALELCRELGATDVVLRLDSELVVRQLEGRYKVKDAKLAKLHARAREAATMFVHFHVEHVPRAENKIADQLANAALDGKELD
jgi:ribonuclease HI